MSLLQFISLLRKNLWIVLLLPIMTASIIFFLTRNEKREYGSNTLIYTGIASGYTLESGQNSKVDYYSVNNAFDNLINLVKSRSTLEEVGIRLLAKHLMLRQPTPAIANANTFQHLEETIPAEVRSQLVDYGSLDRTVENIYRYSQIPKNVVAEKLLNAKNEPYSVKGITAKIMVNREGTSDMMRINYVANDPAVVKQTLELITSVFMRRYREMKVNETGNVVGYFEEQLQKASAKLAGSEERMKDFSSNNKIINYYEQTKYVSAQDRDIDLEIQKERSELEASKAVVKDLEKKLSVRKDVALKSQHINDLRDSLSTLNSKMTLLEMNPGASPANIDKVRKQIESLEQRTHSDIGQLYDLNNSKNGVPAKMLFEDWVDAFVNVDKGEARMVVLDDIKRKYDRYYGQFAPLGSTMNRIEREISVAEKEYLEILHGLNQSKLREQNLLLSTNLKILDAPKFPDKPEDSKRILFIVLGFVVGLFLALTYIIMKEYWKKMFPKSSPSPEVQKVAIPVYQPSKANLIPKSYGWQLGFATLTVLIGIGAAVYLLKSNTEPPQQEMALAEAKPVEDTSWPALDTTSVTNPTSDSTNKLEAPKEMVVKDLPKETITQPQTEVKSQKEGKTFYYVLGGSFGSETAAQRLKLELTQGGYAAKILGPEFEGDTYKVTAGLYKNYKAAKDRAESIAFILDIKTSVYKREI